MRAEVIPPATTRARRPRGSPALGRDLPLVVGAALITAIGSIHLYLWFDYFHRVHVVGVLFLVNAASALLLAAWLLAAGGILAPAAGAGFAAVTLAAFLISTANGGLFGYHEHFWGSWQLGAGAVELVAALLLTALAAARVRRGRR